MNGMLRLLQLIGLLLVIKGQLSSPPQYENGRESTLVTEVLFSDSPFVEEADESNNTLFSFLSTQSLTVNFSESVAAPVPAQQMDSRLQDYLVVANSSPEDGQLETQTVDEVLANYSKFLADYDFSNTLPIEFEFFGSKAEEDPCQPMLERFHRDPFSSLGAVRVNDSSGFTKICSGALLSKWVVITVKNCLGGNNDQDTYEFQPAILDAWKPIEKYEVVEYESNAYVLLTLQEAITNLNSLILDNPPSTLCYLSVLAMNRMEYNRGNRNATYKIVPCPFFPAWEEQQIFQKGKCGVTCPLYTSDFFEGAVIVLTCLEQERDVFIWGLTERDRKLESPHLLPRIFGGDTFDIRNKIKQVSEGKRS